MIVTKRFRIRDGREDSAINIATHKVNDLIAKNDIKKDDIIEYRSECNYLNSDNEYCCTVTISFWAYRTTSL